jgi:hypothetical protein
LKLTWSITKGATMSRASLTYIPRPDATPERELDALAAVYRFILDCRVKKEAARPAAPNGAKGAKDARPASIILPK